MRIFIVGAALISLFASLSALPADTQSPCQPVITEIAPSSVFVGEAVTILGACLVPEGASQDSVNVSAGSAPVTVTAADESHVVAQVNTGLTGESNIMTVETLAGQAAAPFEVKNWIEPAVDDFTPGSVDVLLQPGASIDDVLADLGGSDP